MCPVRRFIMNIGMLFPGYSHQFVGMGKELYDNSRTVQEYFEEASNCLGLNFVKLCFASSDAELAKVEHAYPALFLTGASLAQMIKEICPEAEINTIAGHGVGQYAALHAAGALSLPDGLYLLSKFAQFYSDIRDGLQAKTVAVNGLTERQLKQLIKDQEAEEQLAYIAGIEAERQLVSGHVEAVDALAEAAQAAGSRKCKSVNSIEGFNTPLLQNVAEQLRIYLTKVDFKDPEIELYSNVDGKLIDCAEKAEDDVIRQIVMPHHWKKVLKQCADNDMILIPGPSKALVAELSRLYPEKMVLGIETQADIEYLQTLLAGATEHMVQLA